MDGQDGIDGMLEQENAGLRERVSSLEKKVQQQDDEILCLKSAVADAIRRITVVESSRAATNGMMPPKQNIKSTTHRGLPAGKPTPKKSLGQAGPANPSRPKASQVTPSKAIARTPGSPQKKWPSVPSVGPEVNGHHVGPSRLSGSMMSLPHSPRHEGYRHTQSPRSSREPTFNHEEGYLKIYLKGRPVNLYAPSNLQDYDITQLGQPPTEKLKLEWVYGYRGRDARSNLYLLPTGEIIYFVAGVVVLYNVDEQMQRHYLGHTDDVKCLAVHPDKITIASGQVAGHDKREGKRARRDSEEVDQTNDHWRVAKSWQSPRKHNPYHEGQPHVRIWDSVTLNTLKVIGIGDFDRAIACVAFSKVDGGQFLCAVDEANDHVISVWDWQKGDKGHKITETKSSTEPVLACEFHPCEKNIIVTCGKSQIAFWTLESGALTKKQGLFEKHEKPKYVTCVAYNDGGDAISGDSNGNIFVWAREEIEEGTNRISKALIDAHEGPVFTLCVLNDGSLLSGGGKDRKIIHWDSSYNKTGQEFELPEQYGAVRMISQGKGNMVLVGTTRNFILHGTLDLEFSPIAQGHMDEVWGLAVHPSQNQFMTCAYDKQVHMWDSMAHSLIWSKELPESAHCVAFHPDGNIVVIGTQTPRWIVLDITTREIVGTHTDGSEQIECASFSPDGSHIALGSRDNFIYIHQVTEEGKKYQKVGRCSGHSSFVTHVDWSEDGQYLQSNSGDYELLYWNASTCRQISAAANMRDTKWATHTCTLGFNICGIWPEGADGTDVNSCCRSHKEHLVASGDDFGKVNLYKYPCCQPKSTANIYGGHSSHVTNVQFLGDDSRLLSAGGKDTAIMQWEVL